MLARFQQLAFQDACLPHLSGRLLQLTCWAGCRRKDLERRDKRQANLIAAKAAGTHVPWLRRNLPIMPPPSVAVSQGPTPEKEFVFGASELAASGVRRDATVTKSMDVLSMKVGNALDAQYALPDQVRPLQRPLQQARLVQTACMYHIIPVGLAYLYRSVV